MYLFRIWRQKKKKKEVHVSVDTCDIDVRKDSSECRVEAISNGHAAT